MSENETIKEVEAKARSAKLAAEKALPRSSVETLVRIIKGYAVASNGGEAEVKFKDVAGAAGINPTTVSSNNRFLEESGILIMPKYGYYVPSESAIRFARESAWDENGAKSHLRRIVVGCWYGQVAIQNLALRSSLRKSDLRKSLALKCGAPEGDSNALDFLIDFIVYTDLIVVDESGVLTRGNLDGIEKQAGLGILTNGDSSPIMENEVEGQKLPEQSRNSNISIVIHLHVNDFDELTPDHANRLKQWIESFDEVKNTEIQLEQKAVDSSE
ncbi:hypothetical protein CEE37_00420 [candidate division LCP-89 bacterium B3_LCP]|uniref:Uncharacterized protein n=1 Tax=candidate division LCP-89 bacterium B3_LCP TaxID=2012998 RepID=A0A532V4P8_UNCL8|nr:MAG: hypothetical protein CEE37_00420 [candidate division LCP-89 bacterium B3_LCP]